MKQIPDLKKIIVKAIKYKEGTRLDNITGKFVKKGSKEQSSHPKDKSLLKKLRISKGDKVLSLASYYASWAEEIAKSGCKVDINDVSKSLLGFCRKNKRKFSKYILADYSTIPKKLNQYDWSFTYEAVGGKQGLPIACIRGLMNKKGVIITTRTEAPGSKHYQYPKIVKLLGRLYKAKSSVYKFNVLSVIPRETRKWEILVCTLKTNKKAQQMAKKDIEVLNKKKFSKDDKASINRLSQIAKLIKPEFRKSIEI